MAEPTRLVRDDAYEAMGHAYLCVQIAALDAALSEAGISDLAVRQQVCESFVFEMGNFHDQGWLRPNPEAEPVYPLVCFSRQYIHTDAPISVLGVVYAAADSFAYHEAAFGNVDLFFQGDPAAIVETGSFEGAQDA